jgi:predicted nucleic acid-binding Zn ribbon protein
MDLDIGKPKIDLREQPTIICENCQGEYFKEVVILKKVSRLLTGASDDSIVPFPTYKCDVCAHVNQDFRLFDEKSKTEE